MPVLRRILLSATFAAMIAPLAWWTDYYATSRAAQISVYFEIISVVVMICLAATAFSAYLVVPIPAVVFWLWATLSLVWSINPVQTLLNAASSAIFIIALSAYARTPDFRHGCRWAAWTIVVGLALLGAKLGLTHRSFGGVEPNMLGHFSMAALFLFAISGRLRWWGIVALAGFLIYTQSRTILIGMTFFLAFRYVVLPLGRSAKSVLFTPAVTIVGSMIALLSVRSSEAITLFVSSLIGVQDKVRLSDTLTGRTNFWRGGLSLFTHHPVFGLGLATRERADLRLGDTLNAHSGLVNLLLDLGIIGGALYAWWYLWAYWRSLTSMRKWPASTAMTCTAMLVAMLPMLVAEGSYMTLFDPETIALIIALCTPFVPAPVPPRAPIPATPPVPNRQELSALRG